MVSREKYPVRKNLRLVKHNYSSPGAYFVTICTQDRCRVFGKIAARKMILNLAGVMVSECWLSMFERFSNLQMDRFVIMPDHFHAILCLKRQTSWPQQITEIRSLGQYISWFKRFTTTRYIRNVKNNGWRPFSGRLWQRNYYERIIRDSNAHGRIRQYIIDNPKNYCNRANQGRA